jgi:hypothetical protein
VGSPASGARGRRWREQHSRRSAQSDVRRGAEQTTSAANLPRFSAHPAARRRSADAPPFIAPRASRARRAAPCNARRPRLWADCRFVAPAATGSALLLQARADSKQKSECRSGTPATYPLIRESGSFAARRFEGPRTSASGRQQQSSVVFAGCCLARSRPPSCAPTGVCRWPRIRISASTWSPSTAPAASPRGAAPWPVRSPARPAANCGPPGRCSSAPWAARALQPESLVRAAVDFPILGCEQQSGTGEETAGSRFLGRGLGAVDGACSALTGVAPGRITHLERRPREGLSGGHRHYVRGAPRACCMTAPLSCWRLPGAAVCGGGGWLLRAHLPSDKYQGDRCAGSGRGVAPAKAAARGDDAHDRGGRADRD